MLVRFLAPLRRPDACRDAIPTWHLDHWVEEFEYCAKCSRYAPYLKTMFTHEYRRRSSTVVNCIV